MLLCCHRTKVQWSQVISDGSKPGLSGPVNPLSLVSRRSKSASLGSPFMILPGISTAEMTKKGKTMATNSVRQGWLSIQFHYLFDGVLPELFVCLSVC